MTLLVYVVMAACAVVFAVATIARAATYARQPMHLRWEIYPVPREGATRVAAMIPEILFLKGLWAFNRRLWLRSFPFHVGLYLLATAGMGLLVMASVARLAGSTSLGGPAGQVAAGVVAVTGWCGVVLAISGALALLHRRVTDPTLRAYTTAGDIFNLVFFAVALGTLGAGYVAKPAGSPGALSIAIGLLSWDHTVSVAPLLAAGLMSSAALIAYIPLTHMSHFIGKYFTYHSVRWDDAPFNRRTSVALAEYLTYRPTWAAGHISAKGRPTWGEVVTTNPAREDRE
jgi:nitrate reductase gamma subunit